MSERPEKLPGARMCLTLTCDELTVYGNKEAFTSLRNWMSWLEESQKEHFECHITMSLETDASLFEGKRPRNVWPLLDIAFESIIPHRSEHRPGLELTFMVATEEELDEMAIFQDSGVLPDNWNKQA